MANSNLTPQQKAQLFGANTRQHRQMLNTQTVNGGGQNMTFTVPKTRLLEMVSLHVKAVVDFTGDKVETITSKDLGLTTLPYRVLRNVFIDYNNGFRPIRGSAEELALLNMVRFNPRILCPADDSTVKRTGQSMCTIYDAEGGYQNGIRIDKTGEARTHVFEFVLEMPLTLNHRDPVGLILAQSQESLININIDVETDAGLLNDGIKNEYPNLTSVIKNVEVTPMLTTFSIPSSADAFPDLSVLKIVDSRTETFNGGGSNVVKLPVGQIYRKLMIRITDEDGKLIDDDFINSNIELIFNGADIPYSISAKHLRHLNISDLGYELPKGVYLFDFTNQGIPNLGGSRDYVDTERITEFTLRFTTPDAGKINIISEKISRLVG